MIKICVDNKDIKFFIISEDRGKIKSSGDVEMPECWEDTFVALNPLVVGQPPSICFNKVPRNRHSNREPVWTDLNYKITSIEKVKDAKLI